MKVIADTSVLCYLILIEAIDLLPQLFEMIIIPPAVHQELTQEDAPPEVRTFIETAPGWLDIQTVSLPPSKELDFLGKGEREAILLAEELSADLLLAYDGFTKRYHDSWYFRDIGTWRYPEQNKFAPSH